MLSDSKLEVSKHPVLAKLHRIIHQKQSNLAVSADVTTSEELINLAECVQDHICVLKTHIDIISDFTPEVTKKLRALADKYNFLLFEDRKFADIGNTVCHQVRDGVYQVASWADIINAHILPGNGIINGLKKGCEGREVGLLLLAQMSSQNNFFTKDYTEAAVNLAYQHQDFVIGFIAQEKLTDDDSFVVMTPGVQLNAGVDALGQQYNTPETAILDHKTDIVIVGRGIYKAENPKEAAIAYQQKAYKAYLQVQQSKEKYLT
ncbi:orotidine-5'-phosphate decarboxylase [Thiotrichales bacterium 19S11-10]|nr:orotidine-5'-phosphate decarboxylase [Thiotrichales bacterium 19S11-10]